ncbi:MAG: hypothetical protein FWF49_02650, partial [Oscillospiraceae bacterium]|nr:hypothetical protein [Oscillospiraceae bacterium]
PSTFADYVNKYYYKADWDGSKVWLNNGDNGQPIEIMTSGTTVNIIMAAAYAQNLQDQGKIA